MKTFFITTFILIPLSLFADTNENIINSFHYQENPVFFSVKTGYRYPTGTTSTFDDGINYEETSSQNIYKPGLALGLNSGVVMYPLLFGVGMEGGFLPLTSEGQKLANQRRPEWDKVDVEYASFEFFFGTYLFSYDLLSCYTTISIGNLAVNFATDGEEPDNKDYFGSAINLVIQIRPFEDKTWFCSINGRYQFYVSKPVIPKDLSILIGFGKSVTFSQGCSCIGAVLSSHDNDNF